MAQVQTLAWELLHATGAAEKKKKKKKKPKTTYNKYLTEFNYIQHKQKEANMKAKTVIKLKKKKEFIRSSRRGAVVNKSD